MKCIRCGYCCFAFDVIIVKPENIDDFDPDGDESEMSKLMHKKGDTICPHLKLDDGDIATCKVHDKPWYKTTPCYYHTVIGNLEDACRVGVYHLTNNWRLKYLKEKV